MVIAPRLRAMAAVAVFLIACAYAGYVNGLLKGAIADLHRGAIVSGFIVGAGMICKYLSLLGIKRDHVISPSGMSRIVIRNYSEAQLSVMLEPWTDSEDLAPEEVLYIEGGDACDDDITIDYGSDDSISVWCPPGSTLRKA
jgi:hypothetical protein